MAGFAALTVGLGALWRAFGDGLFVEHALACASHNLAGVSLPVVADLFVF